MLTSIFRALCNHLSLLGLPAYLADCVPDGAALPYFTADIQPPLASGTKGSLTLTFWCAGDQSNVHRLNQADLLLETFPGRGLRLAAGSGAITLTQEGGAQCVTQHGAQGVITRWTLRFFPHK